jgi:hypothetical protein
VRHSQPVADNKRGISSTVLYARSRRNEQSSAASPQRYAHPRCTDLGIEMPRVTRGLALAVTTGLAVLLALGAPLASAEPVAEPPPRR